MTMLLLKSFSGSMGQCLLGHPFCNECQGLLVLDDRKPFGPKLVPIEDFLAQETSSRVLERKDPFDLAQMMSLFTSSFFNRLRAYSPQVLAWAIEEYNELKPGISNIPNGKVQLKKCPSDRSAKHKLFDGSMGTITWSGLSPRLIRFLDSTSCMGAGKHTSFGQGGVVWCVESTSSNE